MYLQCASWHSSVTLTEVFPCLFLSCKANARIKPTKTGHGPHSSKSCVVLYIVRLVSFCVLFVRKCVLYYCHRVLTQLQLTNISYHIISYHIISYHIISFHIYWPFAGKFVTPPMKPPQLNLPSLSCTLLYSIYSQLQRHLHSHAIVVCGSPFF